MKIGFGWLLSLWHERQRSIDIKILWPLCKKHAPDMDRARVAFATHAFLDSAWLCLGDEQIKQIISSLE